MLEPEAVSAILRLSELGWGSKRISRETRDQPQHGEGVPRGRRLPTHALLVEHDLAHDKAQNTLGVTSRAGQ
jgi:hypothetical protein